MKKKRLPCLAVIAVLVLCFTAAGCKKQSTRMSFHVTTVPETNEGRAIHGVVKAVTQQEFVTDSYDRIAASAYSNPPAKGVLRTFALVPGSSKTIKLEKELRKGVGLYFLFSEPGEQWKVFLPNPIQDHYRFALDRNSVEQY